MRLCPLARAASLALPLLLVACARHEPGDPDGAAHADATDVPERVREEVPAEVREALASAESVELLSLFPYPRAWDPDDFDARGLGDEPTIDGYPILGAAEVDEATRRRLLAALWDGVAESDGRIAACFDPRHGLRAEHGGRTYAAVICFACLSMHFLADGEQIGSATTTESPRPTFRAAVRAAGLPEPDL